LKTNNILVFFRVKRKRNILVTKYFEILAKEMLHIKIVFDFLF
jgi:hypothetical protein